MRELDSCEYRVELEATGQYYCRHSAVHISGNVVNSAVCRYCNQRSTVCLDPRPMPEATKLTEIAATSMAQKAWNFAAAVAAFVSDGLKLVDNETYAKRMAVCEACEFRSGNHCAQCGCMLTLKASGRAFKCPVGKWEAQEPPKLG